MQKYSAIIFPPENDEGLEFYLYDLESAKMLVANCIINGYEVRLKPKEEQFTPTKF